MISETPDNDEEPEALLGDLEQIRELLDEEEEDHPAVPLLDDVVDGGVEVTEQQLDAAPILPGNMVQGDTARTAASVLPDETIESLLGDEWRESTDTILLEARRAIEADRNGWAPEDTDDLHEALKVRIDSTINNWMRELVQQNIDSLRATLVAELSEALKAHFKDELDRGQ